MVSTLPSSLREKLEEIFGSVSDSQFNSMKQFLEDGNESDVEETSISNMVKDVDPEQMNVILRTSEHDSDVHFSEIWETKWGKKVGVSSPKEASDVFSEQLDWDTSHHKWKSPRVSDTKKWEVDLEATFYVALVMLNEGYKVSVDDEVLTEYLSAMESA